MYREIEKFYSHEVLLYSRKSRFDNPTLSVEDVLMQHDKILEDYAIEQLGGPIPAEIKDALCKAYESMPKPVDYKEKILKFTDALEALEDPDVSATIKNQYLKDIIERIDYDRPAIVRITKQNKHLYYTDTDKGLKYHTEPYKIRIKIKS